MLDLALLLRMLANVDYLTNLIKTVEEQSILAIISLKSNFEINKHFLRFSIQVFLGLYKSIKDLPYMYVVTSQNKMFYLKYS